VDDRHSEANFRIQRGNDELLSTSGCNGIDYRWVFPRVDGGPSDWLLIREEALDLGD
jgi:hypothetical protein